MLSNKLQNDLNCGVSISVFDRDVEAVDFNAASTASASILQFKY